MSSEGSKSIETSATMKMTFILLTKRHYLNNVRICLQFSPPIFVEFKRMTPETIRKPTA